MIRAAFVSATTIPASLCLLSLPHLHANPAGTTGPARILRISPRLPPCQPTRHLSRAKCGDLPPHSPRSFSPFSFLHICMILATRHALRVPVSKRISSHLHVLSSVSVVPISCAEQSLDFPFSSAFLIGGTGCLYYRSSTFPSLRRNCSGFTAPRPAGTATLSSSAVHSRCWSGSRSTCPDQVRISRAASPSTDGHPSVSCVADLRNGARVGSFRRSYGYDTIGSIWLMVYMLRAAEQSDLQSSS